MVGYAEKGCFPVLGEAEFWATQLEHNTKSMMKTKLTIITVLAAALFGVGCATTEPAFVSDGLVAYYPFNGNAKDESGNGNDGEVNGATLGADRNGISGGAYSFDGDDYIDIGKDRSLKIQNGTLSAWIYSENFTRFGGVVSFIHSYHDGQGGYVMLARSGLGFLLTNPGYEEFHSRGELEKSKWQHIVVSFNDLIAEGYVDGILVRGMNIRNQTTVFNESSKAFIGLNSNKHKYEEDDYFKGSIDDVRIYNRALSTEEVKALYDLEKPKK